MYVYPGLVMWDLWWTKWRWGRFSPSTSVSPANLHSINCSTITLIIWGLYNRPEVAAVPSGLSTTSNKKVTVVRELSVEILRTSIRITYIEIISSSTVILWGARGSVVG
jgi:hypothetical protein